MVKKISLVLIAVWPIWAAERARSAV